MSRFGYSYNSYDIESNESQDMFANFYLNDRFSDIMLIIDGNRIPSHKLVLSQMSPVFKAMIFGDFKESNDNEIQIKETTTETFKAMLEFIYKQKYEMKGNYLFAIEVLKLSHRFQIEGLVESIERHLKEMITINNFMQLFKLSTLYGLNGLLNHMKRFTKGKAKDIKSVLKTTFTDINTSLDKAIEEINKTKSKHQIIESQGNDFENYYLNENLSDITLIIDGNRIHSHKILLSAKSSVFDSMFSKEFEESKAKEVQIKDTSFDESFKLMFDLIYKKKFVMKEGNDYLFAIEVLKTSNKFKISSLVNLMERVLGKMITNENFVELFQFYHCMNSLCDLKTLFYHLKRFVDYNGSQLINFISFIGLSNDHINSYLSLFKSQTLVIKAIQKVIAENSQKHFKQFKRFISLELCSIEDIESLRDIHWLTQTQAFNVLKRKYKKLLEKCAKQERLDDFCHCDKYSKYEKYRRQYEENYDEDNQSSDHSNHSINYGYESEDEVQVSPVKKFKQHSE